MHALDVIAFAGALLMLGETILNLTLLPRLQAAERPAAEPRVSVIIPARDEEQNIAETVRCMLGQDYTNLEVIVVDDRSSDGTAAVLREAADPRLLVVAGEEPPPGWLGKPWAIQQGSRKATGELLLIADADVRYAPGAISAAVAYLERTRVSLVSLFPRVEMRGFWEHAGMTQLVLTALSYFPAWLGNRTKIIALGIGGGPGTLVRRKTFDAAGGYEFIRDAVIDDVGFVRHIRLLRKQTHLAFADDLVSIRMYRGLREIVNGFTKNVYSSFGRRYWRTAVVLVATVVFNVFPFVRAGLGVPLAVATVASILAARVLLFWRLRIPIGYALILHPVTALLWMWIMIRSAWVTGFRRTLEWRGRRSGEWTEFGR